MRHQLFFRDSRAERVICLHHNATILSRGVANQRPGLFSVSRTNLAFQSCIHDVLAKFCPLEPIVKSHNSVSVQVLTLAQGHVGVRSERVGGLTGVVESSWMAVGGVSQARSADPASSRSQV